MSEVPPVFSAGDSAGDRTDLCWSDQELILAFFFMSIGCLYALSLYHPLYALHCILCGIFTAFIYPVSGLLLCWFHLLIWVGVT
jgi:hypothetical protein